jgi:integrase
VPTIRKELTARFVATVGPAAAGKRDEYVDTQVKNFALRVTPNGAKSYVMSRRWPGGKMTIKRTIGDAGIMPLATARDIAREWLRLASLGIDPKRAKEQREAEEARDRAVTFAAVAEDYIAEDLAGKRRRIKDVREIRRELLPVWGKRPAAHITRDDVLELVKAIKARGHTATARIVLSHIKRIFVWACHQEKKRYGPLDNPAAIVSSKRVLGPKKPRQRTLSDDELRALWRACLREGYPCGDAVRLMLLTGGRREEISQARWRELNQHTMLLTIPPARFKSDAEHLMPLSSLASEIVRALPRHAEGEFMFTTTMGAKAINGWSRAKEAIDRRMLRTLRALARARGEDPAQVTLERWVMHDLRHVVRTRMAELRVPDNVAEMIICHGKRGMSRVYDQHHYLNEMREAAEAWAEMLRGIVAGTPAKVVRMKRRRRA